MPDLSENLINESQTWDEIREIKAMPVPMAQKRELKNQLQVRTYKFKVEIYDGKGPKECCEPTALKHKSPAEVFTIIMQNEFWLGRCCH